MVWLLLGAMGVMIADEFQLSATQKGVLLATPLLSGALLRIPVGLSSDRFGAKRTGLLVLACELVGLAWGWLGASSFAELLLMGLLLGVAGASFAVALPIAGHAYPPAHQGFALGVAASANSGVVLSMWVAPRVALMGGWHAAMAWMILPVVLTVATFMMAVPSDTLPNTPPPSRHQTIWREFLADVRREAALPWLCAMYAITFGGFVGFSSALPMLLHDQYAVDMVMAGSITAICGLSGAVLRPLGGYVADRLGGLMVLPIVLGGLAIFLSFIGAVPPLPLAVGVSCAAIALMGFGNGVVFKVVADHFPKQIGIGSGVVGAAGAGGGMLFPLLLGSFKDLSGTYAFAFWLFAVCSCLVALMAMRMRRRSEGAR